MTTDTMTDEELLLEYAAAQTRTQFKMLNWIRMIGFMIAVWFFLSVGAGIIWILDKF